MWAGPPGRVGCLGIGPSSRGGLQVCQGEIRKVSQGKIILVQAGDKKVLSFFQRLLRWLGLLTKADALSLLAAIFLLVRLFVCSYICSSSLVILNGK